MIVKKLIPRSFAEAEHYIFVGKDINHPAIGMHEIDGASFAMRADRVAWFETRNLPTDNPELAVDIMSITAGASVRCKNPEYHLSINWPEGLAPSKEEQIEIADDTIAYLGLDEHEVLMGGHKDTDHAHVHLLINRVHPVTGRAWKDSYDYRRCTDAMREAELKLGMEPVLSPFDDPSKRRQVRAGEHAMNQREGVADLPRFAFDEVKVMRAQLAPTFTEAENWQDLSTALQEQGMEIVPKGQGAILTDGVAQVKLSDLRKNIRLRDLQERFGETLHGYEQRREVEPVSKLDEFLRGGAGEKHAAHLRQQRNRGIEFDV